jgi:hypothetical protein
VNIHNTDQPMQALNPTLGLVASHRMQRLPVAELFPCTCRGRGTRVPRPPVGRFPRPRPNHSDVPPGGRRPTPAQVVLINHYQDRFAAGENLVSGHLVDLGSRALVEEGRRSKKPRGDWLFTTLVLVAVTYTGTGITKWRPFVGKSLHRALRSMESFKVSLPGPPVPAVWRTHNRPANCPSHALWSG